MAQLDLDRVLQQLTNDFNKFRTAFTQTMTGAQKTLTQAESTVKSIVQQAGGAAWSTFTGSLNLVGLQIARFFIPTITMASKSLQDMSNWLEDMTPEGKGAVKQFAEIAVAASVAVGAMKLLGIKLDGTTIAFGALLMAMQAFTFWLDTKIEQKFKTFAEAAGKQYTRSEVEASAPFQKAAGMTPADRKAYLERQLRDINKEIQHYTSMTPVEQFGTKNYDKIVKRLYEQQALYSAIRRNLVFGEKLPETVSEYKVPGLGGGYGIGGLVQMLFPQVKEFLGIGGPAGAHMESGRGGRGFRFDWPTEMQPRFSAIEEARKQFQLGALKSPLEQETMRLQRQMAQEAIQEAPSRNRAWDALANLGNLLGLR